MDQITRNNQFIILVIQNSKTFPHDFQPILLLGCLAFLGKQDSLNVGQHSALGDGNTSKQLVKLFVVPAGQLEMTGNNPALLIVSGSIPSQLQYLGSEVFHHSSHVDWSSSTNPFGVVALPEQPVDPAHRELKTSPARARL